MRLPVKVALPLTLAGVTVALTTASAGAAPGRPDGPAAAAPPPAPTASPSERSREHGRVIDFWTVDRVRRAVPRDFTRTSDGRFRLTPATGDSSPAPAAKGGGGNGGGGGGGNSGGGGGKGADGSTAVLGASWTAGGAVARTTGKVLFTMGTTDYVCSGDVIRDGAADRSIVLTAAHCVFDETAGAWATNWMFIPDYDSSPVPLTGDDSFCQYTRFGCWTATALVAHRGFTSAGGFNDQAALHDWGFAAMDGTGANGTLLEDETQAQHVDVSGADQVGTEVSAFGYPAARPYTGADLTYCRGTLTTDPYNGGQTLGLGCKMNGGSSGGPWFTPFDDTTGTGTQMSVNSYRYGSVQAMFGPRFTTETQATYQAALTANGNTTVSS
jgi:hypothetical protein